MISSILPPGVVDPLPFLGESMAARPDLGGGRLQPRSPEMVFVALRGLVEHAGSDRARLDALDGGQPPDPDPLAWSRAYFAGAKATNPDGLLSLGASDPWRIAGGLAAAVLAIEARLRSLEGLPPIGPDPESPAADPLRRVVDQVELDGAMHRDEASFWRSLEAAITRVIDVEARLAAAEAQPRKAI